MEQIVTTNTQPVSTTADNNNNQFAMDELDMESEPSFVMSIFSEQVSQTKLLASLILFIITLLCGYLPVRVLLNQNYIQYAMFAGGGVLMATAFCHLIPEAHDNYKTTLGLNNQHQHHHHHHHHQHLTIQPLSQVHNHLDQDHNHNHLTSNLSQLIVNGSSSIINNNNSGAAANESQTIAHEHLHDATISGNSFNIPYLEMTLCCGFFFMYLVEQLMAKLITDRHHDEPSVGRCNTSLVVGASGDEQLQQHQHQHCEQELDNHHHCQCHHSSSVVNVISTSSSSTATASNLSVLTTNQQAHLSPNSSSSSNYSELYKFIRGLLIVSAFMAHSIFDGVAIGSQETVEKVWTIFLAISCHKLIIAAVVGLELYVATLESHLWTLVHLSIFSIMSPLGIILVVLAQSSLHIDSNHPAMILLQSFATGTLLYIVFVEILQPKENQAYEKNRLGKSVSLITGFALMLIVLTLIDE